MNHISIPPSPGGETDAPRRYDAVDRVPRELFIAGDWTSSAGGTLEVLNPATEDVIAEAADATVDDAQRALRAAAAAQASWALTPARARSEILHRAYELMVERTDLLAEVMTLEMGKPLAEARGEVGYAAVLAGAKGHAGDLGNHCGMLAGADLFDDAGVESSADEGVVGQGLGRV